MRYGTDHKGFTLIELLIVIVILGILLAVASTSYQKHMISFYRGEAKAVLLQAQLDQEEYQMFNQSYASKWEDLHLPSFNKYYDFSIKFAEPQSYMLEANVKENTSQIKDLKLCHKLTVDQNSNHTNNICWKN